MDPNNDDSPQLSELQAYMQQVRLASIQLATQMRAQSEKLGTTLEKARQIEAYILGGKKGNQQ